MLRERGPFTVTVPGVVAGWHTIAQLGSRFDLPSAIDPSITLATEGVSVRALLANGIRDCKSVLLRNAGCSGVFFTEGRPLREGDVLRQRNLGKSFGIIAVEGPAFNLWRRDRGVLGK